MMRVGRKWREVPVLNKNDPRVTPLSVVNHGISSFLHLESTHSILIFLNTSLSLLQDESRGGGVIHQVGKLTPLLRSRIKINGTNTT